MKRVVILGRGASGKSTLAKRLGEISGLPVVELDKIFWRPGLVATPRDEWVAAQDLLVAKDGWIIDGDLGNLTLLRLVFAPRTLSSFWTSPFCVALIARFDGRASASTSGGGSWPTAGKAVPFSLKRSPSTHRARNSMYFVNLIHCNSSSTS